MCGIIGYIGYSREGQWGQTHSILTELYLASEHQGVGVSLDSLR